MYYYVPAGDGGAAPARTRGSAAKSDGGNVAPPSLIGFTMELSCPRVGCVGKATQGCGGAW